MVDIELVEQLMRAVRVKSSAAEEEIIDLIEACQMEMSLAGVFITDMRDPLFRQAVKLYCKAYYGYDKDTEKFRAAYAALRDSMALSGDYKKAGDSDG